MRPILPLCLFAAVVAADTVDQVATQALEAVRAEESAKLRTLALRETPDPWLVAAELCARGEFAAAEMFARAAPRADTGRMPEQVEAWKQQPPPAAALEALAAGIAELDRGEVEKAAARIEPLEFPEGTLAHARVLAVRARLTGKPEAYESAAVAAESIGWLRLAAANRRAQVHAFEHGGDPGSAVAAANAWVAIETRRGVNANLPGALTEAGRLSLMAKKLPEAEDLLRRALRQAQREKDAMAIARAEALLGGTLFERGAKQDARVYLLRSRKELESEPDRLFEVLELLVDLDREIDGVEKGIARAGEMLAIARERKAPEAEASALSALARMELARKDFRAAAQGFEKAEDAYRRAKAPLLAATIATERGELALRMGRRTDAAAALRRALQLAGPDGPKPLRARIHAALGEWAVETGAEKEAVRHLDAAARLAVEIGDSALAASTLARRGRLALRLGTWDEARPTLEKALEQEQAAGDDARAARTMLDLAEIDLAQDKPDAARKRATEALALARGGKLPATLARAIALDAQSRLDDEDADALIERLRAGAREALTMLETERISADARFETALDRLLLVATDAAIAANSAGTLLAAGEFGRSRRLLHALGGRAPLEAALTSPQLAAEIEETSKAERAALEEYQRQHEKMAHEPMQRARAEALKLKAKLEALEKRRLADLSAAKWLLSPGVPTLEDVEGALGADETLLYYCVGTRSAAVLKVTSSGETIIRVGDRPELDEQVEALRAALEEEDPYPALRQFGQRHMGSFTLPAGRDVVVVPAHPFDQVPFDAVAPEQTFRYVSSAADLVRLAVEGKKTGVGVLGVGKPTYGGDEVQLRLVHLRNGLPLRRLEASGTFTQEIADLALLGASATEAELRDAVHRRERWRAIHFALPGVLDARRPHRSSLALTVDEGGDGLLTVYEMMGMGLPADLCALAACEPAKGDYHVDRAIGAVTQAIHLAGSARVIVSTRRVDDDAAATFMRHFYRFWADGNTSAPLALRRAQQRVSSLPGWIHPKAWAGWQLWGAR